MLVDNTSRSNGVYGDDNNYNTTINITPQHLSNTLRVFVQITSQTPLTRNQNDKAHKTQ